MTSNQEDAVMHVSMEDLTPESFAPLRAGAIGAGQQHTRGFRRESGERSACHCTSQSRTDRCFACALSRWR